MSGGSFNYLYLDADGVSSRIEKMAKHADKAGFPDHVGDDLRSVADDLSGMSDTMKTVEWQASGDHSLERAVELIENDD